MFGEKGRGILTDGENEKLPSPWQSRNVTNFTFHISSDDLERGDTGEAIRTTLIEAMGIADILVGDVKGNMSIWDT